MGMNWSLNAHSALGITTCRADEIRSGDEIHGMPPNFSEIDLPAQVLDVKPYLFNSAVVVITVRSSGVIVTLSERVFGVKRAATTQCTTMDMSRFPHACPRCGAPAYIGGLNNVECSDGCRT